jgi:hypothetical protein
MSARRLSHANKAALTSADQLIGEGPHPDPPSADAEPAKIQTVWNFGTETTGFNYATLSEGDAAEARDAADRIRKLQHVERYAVGELLVALRPKFQHGQWLAWLELEMRISDESAFNYMRYYRLAQRAPVELSQLMSAAVAYQVARLSEVVQDKVFETAQAKQMAGGKRITAGEVKALARPDPEPPAGRPSGSGKGGAASDDAGAERESEQASGSGKGGAASDDAATAEAEQASDDAAADEADDREVDRTSLAMSVAMQIYHSINSQARRDLYRILGKRGDDVELLRCLRKIPR